jgi:hypothetical protein
MKGFVIISVTFLDILNLTKKSTISIAIKPCCHKMDIEIITKYILTNHSVLSIKTLAQAIKDIFPVFFFY